MSEQIVHLTVAERDALENRALRQQALAAQALIGFSGLTQMSEAKLVAGLEYIRSLDKSAAKAMRLQLAEATRMLGFLQGADDSGTQHTGTTEVISIKSGSGQEGSQLVDEAKTIVPVGVENTEEMVLEITEGRKWAQDILGDMYEHYGRLSDEDLAHKIYELAGSPVTRRSGGLQAPDPIERITARLLGLSCEQIATHEGRGWEAVERWFYMSITRPIKGFNARKPAALPQAGGDVVEASEIPVTNEQQRDDEPSYMLLADSYMNVLGCDDSYRAAMEQLFNPEATGGMSERKREILARIQDSAFTNEGTCRYADKLDNAQVYQLRRLCGVFIQPGQQKIKKKDPMTVADVVSEAVRQGKSKTENIERLYGALQQLASVFETLEQNAESASSIDRHHVVMSIATKLRLSREESKALWQRSHYAKDNDHRYYDDNTKKALEAVAQMTTARGEVLRGIFGDDKKTHVAIMSFFKGVFGDPFDLDGVQAKLADGKDAEELIHQVYGALDVS